MGVNAIIASMAGCAAFAGLLMLWRSPRRGGGTLHCRKCNCLLTGLDLLEADARCPECGAALARAGAIVTGECRVGWGRAALGLALLVAGVVMVAPALAPAAWLELGLSQWRQHRPTFLVRWDLESADTAVTGRALAELRRRVESGGLSEDEAGLLAEFCLNEQLRAQAGSVNSEVAWDILGDLYESGRLSSEQQQRMLRNMVKTSLIIRPQVPAGVEFVIRVEHQFHAPDGFWCQIAADAARLVPGDKPLTTKQPLLERPMPIGHAQSSSTSHRARIDLPGSYTVAMDYSVRIIRGLDLSGVAPADAGTEPPETLWEEQLSLSTGVEVLGQDSGMLVELAQSAELDAQVRRSVRLTSMSGGGPELLFVVERVGGLSADLAFEVLLDSGVGTVPLGTATLSAQAERAILGVQADVPGGVPNKFAIVLRSSPAIALRLTTFARIWDGELRFEGFTYDPISGRIMPEQSADPVLIVHPASAPAE